MAGYRVTDIETVADGRHWTPPSPKYSVRYVDGDSVFWQREDVFPPPQAHRVVAMAWVDLSGEDGKWYSYEGSTYTADWGYGAEADGPEREMLEEFGMRQRDDGACLVTWNGRTFDLPVINMRSFLHGIPCEWYYRERDVRYRYTEAGHCDLMDVFGDYGAARSMKLGDVATMRGLPGKIGEVSGKAVGEIYDAFDPKYPIVDGSVTKFFKTLDEAKQAVGRYCLLDAMQTAILFAESRVHKGMIDREYYDRVVKPSLEGPLAIAIEGVAGRKAA